MLMRYISLYITLKRREREGMKEGRERKGGRKKEGGREENDRQGRREDDKEHMIGGGVIMSHND